MQPDVNNLKFPIFHLDTYKDLNLKNFILFEEQRELEQIDYLSLLFSENIYDQHKGVIGLRKLISKQAIPFQVIIDQGCLQKLINFADQTNYLHLQFDSIWILANIASGEHKECQFLVNKGLIQVFEAQLGSPYMHILENIYWGLGNIAGECVEYSRMIFNSKIPRILMKTYKNLDYTNQKTICWMFSIILKNEATTNQTKNDDIELLLKFMVEKYCKNDPESKSEILAGLTMWMKEKFIYIFFSNKEFIKALVDDFESILNKYNSSQAPKDFGLGIILKAITDLTFF